MIGKCTVDDHGRAVDDPGRAAYDGDRAVDSRGRTVYQEVAALTVMARVGPGHCYRIGPIRFLAGWHIRRSWTRVSLVSLGLVV